MKDEIYERIKVCSGKLFPDFVVTPELPKSLPSEFREALDYLYLIGATKQATNLIAEFRELLAPNDPLYQELKDYSKKNKQAYDKYQTSSILTTHHKAISAKVDRRGNKIHHFENTNTLIIDEDILHLLLKHNHVTREDLHRLLDVLPEDWKVCNLIKRFIREMSEGALISQTPQILLTDQEFKFILKEMSSNQGKYQSNILEFFGSSYYAATLEQGDEGRLYYVSKLQLPAKRTIILSATADENIYRDLFGDRLHFVDISNVAIQGNIENDTTYSFSRRSLASPNCLNYVNGQIREDEIAITFSNYAKSVKNSDDTVYFWNCSGYDHLKGKNLAIVGCPHGKGVVYALIASCCGVELGIDSLLMSTQIVQRNGFQFKIKTYDNPRLRDIQLWCIESELLQAIGRARVVRTDANVRVFSGLPVRDSKQLKSATDSSFEISNLFSNAVMQESNSYSCIELDPTTNLSLLFEYVN